MSEHRFHYLYVSPNLQFVTKSAVFTFNQNEKYNRINFQFVIKTPVFAFNLLLYTFRFPVRDLVNMPHVVGGDSLVMRNQQQIKPQIAAQFVHEPDERPEV